MTNLVDQTALLSSVIDLRKAQCCHDATKLPWTSAAVYTPNNNAVYTPNNNAVYTPNNNAVYLQPGDYALFPEWDRDVTELRSQEALKRPRHVTLSIDVSTATDSERIVDGQSTAEGSEVLSDITGVQDDWLSR